MDITFVFIFTSFVLLALIILMVIKGIDTNKTEKEREEYEKYAEYLTFKQRISYQKQVDFEKLNNSRDYLSYNSKIYNEKRKLTETEFKTLKGNKLFYKYPKVYFDESEVYEDEIH